MHGPFVPCPAEMAPASASAKSCQKQQKVGNLALKHWKRKAHATKRDVQLTANGKIGAHGQSAASLVAATYLCGQQALARGL